MPDILHRIGVTASPEDVYASLTTIDGLSRWWTEDTTGDAEPGGTIRFRFAGAPEPAGFDMSVAEARPGQRVEWKVVDGPEEWVGTEVSFDLKRADDYTIVLFEHRGWREPVEFMYHCSTKWATFLMSLKSSVETGVGEPRTPRRADQRLALARGRGLTPYPVVCHAARMLLIEGAGRYAEPDETGATYVEHLTVPDLSLGTYTLRSGAVDPQDPHDEDEVYVVTAGRAKFTSGGQTIDVSAGSVFFVPAREEHRFHDVIEDLAVLVFFGPAEGSRGVTVVPEIADN